MNPKLKSKIVAAMFAGEYPYSSHGEEMKYREGWDREKISLRVTCDSLNEALEFSSIIRETLNLSCKCNTQSNTNVKNCNEEWIIIHGPSECGECSNYNVLIPAVHLGDFLK